MSKLRTEHVRQLVAQSLETRGLPADGTYSDFTNGQPLIAWEQQIVRGGQTMWAGWQLQGEQFRRYVRLPHLAGAGDELLAARFRFAAQHPQLFDFEASDSLLGLEGAAAHPVISTKSPHGFNRYNPDFIYRYKKTSDLRVEQLIDAAAAIALTLVDVP